MPYLQGEASRAKESRVNAEDVGAQRIDPIRVALEVLASSHCYLVGSDTTEANSTSYTIVAAAHVAKIGDIIRITSGAEDARLALVNAADSDTITLSQSLASDLGAGVAFDILRFRPPLIGESGATITSRLNTLVTEAYDYISLSYTGDNLTTVVYKSGGSGGTTVATLTLAYTGSRLDTVTKT